MPQPTLPPGTDDFARLYLTGELKDFFPLPPGDTDAALGITRPEGRTELCRGLRAHAERLGAPLPVLEAIERLAQPRSRAVVTGQQTGLLLGPSYTLSKAVSAIGLARRLDTQERPVVPVFWMASQDHDTHEIDYAYLLDESEHLARLELPLPSGVPAGRIPLQGAWLEHIASEIGGLDFPREHRAEVLELLRRTAGRARTFADWFAALLYELLGSEGLIVLDPLEPGIAPLFAPVLAGELRRPLASSKAVNEAGARLRALGLDPQLGRGEDATNLFLEERGTTEQGSGIGGRGTIEREFGRDADEGPQRQLLRTDGNTFWSEARSYGADELLDILASEPARLTPAAGLRPITQDAVLPTAVTVVGPGELRYFAQLGGVYQLFDVAMPLIWPRTQVTVLEPPVRRMLDKFGLSYAELAHDFGGCRDRILLELSGHGESFRETLAALQASCAALLQDVRAIDPTLAGSVERGEAHIGRTLAILQNKSAAALARQESTYARQWRRLERHLFPEGTPQERLISPFSFFLKFGITPVLRAFLELPPSGEQVVRL
ncbi:MAG TPA: bacillithiol biosynthesis BshC [Trueperaceae bacterium]